MTARRRILIVSHVFPPLVAGGAVRMGQFARLLPDHGWDVTVLTGRHSGSTALDTAAVARIRDRATIVEAWSPASAVVKRGAPVPRSGLKRVLRTTVRTAAAAVLFPDREVFWAPAAIQAGQRALREQPCDVVLATCGPATNLLVGRALAATFRLPLIVDFRDLWSTLPMSPFPTKWHRAAAVTFERSMVRRAARLLAVSPAMAAGLADTHGIPRALAMSITNGFDPEHAKLVHDDRAEPRPFRLMYTGSVHVNYNLEPLWQALRSLRDAGTITPATFRAEFVGNLSMEDPARFGVADFVDVSPFVPHEQVFDAFARADALLVVETPGYYAQYSYAAKVFDYLLTGKPVVGLVELGGYSARLLEDAKVGYCVDPGGTENLQRALTEVIGLKGAPPRSIDPDAPPLREFNRRHLVAKLAEILDAVHVEASDAASGAA